MKPTFLKMLHSAWLVHLPVCFYSWSSPLPYVVPSSLGPALLWLPALFRLFFPWFCSPPPSWRGKADTQVFRAIRPAFHKGADGTVTRRCFLVAQLVGKTREKRKYKSILCENRPLDPAHRYSHPVYLFQELNTDQAVIRGIQQAEQAPGEERRERE